MSWRRFLAGADHLFYLFFDLAANCTKASSSKTSSQCSQSDILAIRWGKLSEGLGLRYLPLAAEVQCGCGALVLAQHHLSSIAIWPETETETEIKDPQDTRERPPGRGLSCPSAPRTRRHCLLTKMSCSPRLSPGYLSSEIMANEASEFIQKLDRKSKVLLFCKLFINYPSLGVH